MGPIVNQSSDLANDFLTGPGSCGSGVGVPFQDRCGYGPRQPLLVISPFARPNFVDHGVTDQSSILQFIEDNWGLGRIGNDSTDDIAGSLLPMFDFSQSGKSSILLLDPATGTPAGKK
jgi:phospholipase C